MTHSITRTKRAVYSMLAMGMSVALCVLVLEGIARVCDFGPALSKQYGNNVADRYLPYKPKPLSVVAGRSATGEFDYHHEHNSFGFRDIEHSLEAAPKVFRILGLGDSFTYGIGADFEKTYLYQLEQMLNEREGDHPRVEIIKAGIPRYFPEPERILLEQYGVHYSPNLVLVGFVANDVIDTYFGLDAVVVDKSGYLKTREAKEIGSLGVWFYKKSRLFRIALKRYIIYQASKNYRPRFGDIYKDNGFHEKQWKVIEHEYSRMASIARQINSHFVVVHIPQKGPWNEIRFYPSQRLEKWARQNDAGFVDALPAMIEASHNKALYHSQDGHCTPDGYAIIAEAIYKYLTENNLVP